MNHKGFAKIWKCNSRLGAYSSLTFDEHFYLFFYFFSIFLSLFGRATWLSHKFAPARICFISSRAERRSLFKAWSVRAWFRSKNSNSFLLPLHKFEKRIFLAKIQSTVKKSTFSRWKNFCSWKIWFRQESIITKFIARAHFFVREFDIPIAGEK